MRVKTLSIAAATVITVSACGGRPTDNPGPSNPGSAQLMLTYVSGHLGQSGCHSGATQDASGAGGGVCSKDAYCPPMPCEGAQVTVRVRNVGDADITDLAVGDLALLDQDGQAKGELTIDRVALASGASFDGKLPKGGEVTLHIEFSGPIDTLLSQMRQSASYGAPVRVTFVAKNVTKTLTTPELQLLPSGGT